MLPVIYIGLGLSGFGNDPIESAMLFVNGNLPATALVVSVLLLCFFLGVLLMSLSYGEQRKQSIRNAERNNWIKVE